LLGTFPPKLILVTTSFQLNKIQLTAFNCFLCLYFCLLGQSRQDDVHRQTGGSGDPRLHFHHSPSRTEAKDRARSHSGGRTPIHHTAHKPGEYPHFHPANKDGKILKDGSHYQYGPKKTEPQKQGDPGWKKK
jgi:hypothetical protein